MAGVPWSECQVMKLATSNCTIKEDLHIAGMTCVQKKIRMGKCTVTACRTEKVRKGGDFFYGKSSNENHIKGL